MNSGIIIDLHASFAARCAAELQAAGYTPPTGSNEEIIRAYANVRHRRVLQRPRRVHRAVYTFLAKVEAGDDLRQYQSAMLESANFNDGMLNDFGIQHFHLGTAPHPTKSGFVARTEPVLFALVRNDDFYSLGCHAHGAWSQTSLLDLIHAQWPHVIAPYSPSPTPGPEITGLSRIYTDSDVEILRKAGINAITQRPDGTIHVPPGGGVTSDRTSGKVAREVADINGLCRKLEANIETAIVPRLISGELQPPVVVQLEQRDTKTFAVLDGGRGEYELHGFLQVPPL